MTKNIWFIRHAESITNAGGFWPDQFTNPLTLKGEEQAEVVSNVFKEKPSLIVTSPYIRTKLTANPTLQRWPDVPHQQWLVQEYCQLCFATRGLLDQARIEQLREKPRNDPNYKDGPSAESFNDLIKRVDRTVERIFSLDDEKVIIFSHGYFLSVLFYRLANRDLTSVSQSDVREYNSERKIPNTAVFHYLFHDNGVCEEISASFNHLPE